MTSIVSTEEIPPVLPNGLRTWSKILTLIGPVGVIALFLVYTNAQVLPKIQTDLIALRAESQNTQEMLRGHLAQQQELHRLLIRICVNTAKDSVAIDQCFRAP